MDFLLTLLSGSVGAGIVAGVFGIIMWKLNRKATRDDRQEDRVAEERKSNDELRAGIRMILYAMIKQRARCYIAAGEITLEDLEDLLAMHAIYHDALHGNGFLDNLMDQVKKLPIKKINNEQNTQV